MKFLFAHTLRAKLLLASLLIEVLMLALLIGNSVRLIQEHLEAQTEARIVAIQLAYKTAVALPLAARDYATLRDILDGWRKAEDVLYLAVSDPQGRVLAASGRNGEQPLPQPGQVGDVRHVVFDVDLLNQSYGRVHYGLSTAYIDAAKRELFAQSAGIALLEISLTLFLLSGVGYFLTRHLVLLTEASAQVAAGNYETQIDIKGKDEIAALAENFNTMTDAVRGRIAALSESEQRFRAIADYTYSWENWFGSDGRLRWVNPAVERISGYSPRECLALPDFPLSLVHPDDRELLRRQHSEALGGHTGQDLEFRINCRDGRCIWVALSWQPIWNANGDSLGYRSSIRDITLQHHATEELAYQATHDSLTGLFNRHAFENHLEQALEHAVHDDFPVVLLYIDLDQFKVVNDSCGHVAGDELLIRLASVLHGNLHYGFLARLGGDEFGLVMRNCDQPEALRRAARLIDEIRAFPFSWEGRSFRLGASIGLVRATPELHNVTNLLMAADAACYAAKDRGRNRVEIYDANDTYFRLRHEDFLSLSRVTSALAEGSFELFHQRLTPLRPELPTHAEILLRFRDNLGKLSSPAYFIAAAERYNLMPYLDRWVLEHLCRQLHDWDAAGVRPDITRFAVNVSGASLSDQDFPDFVQEQLAHWEIDPARLCFEITESCAVANLDIALAFIARMKALGAKLALDDFGSGLSSFAYLKRFAVDYLKIDGMFVKHIDEDSSDHAVVTAIQQLARVHGLSTVAEYVCNDAVLAAVQGIGIDYAQGFARHVPEPLRNAVA